MSQVLSFPSPRETLRRQLLDSLDVLNLGETLEIVGSVVSSAGRHMMEMNEPPTEHMTREMEVLGTAIAGMARALRQAREGGK